MLKKILYAIVVIAIIIILAIMWTDSNKKKIENQAPVIDNNVQQVDTSASFSNELDSVDVNSGIDADINSIDTSIKTL